MGTTDKPYRPPDLSEVSEMERLLGEPGDETAKAIEEEIIRYVDGVRDKCVDLIRAKQLAVGDAAVLRPPVQWLQTSLRPLFDVGEMLPAQDRLRFLRRLKLVIMAAYNVGGFTQVTRTVADSVRKKAVADRQMKATEAARKKRAPTREARQKRSKRSLRSVV